jgi:hypothetical protein
MSLCASLNLNLYQLQNGRQTHLSADEDAEYLFTWQDQGAVLREWQQQQSSRLGTPAA